MDAPSSSNRSQVFAWKDFLFQHGHLLLKALVIVAAGTTVLYPTLHGWWFGDDDLYLGNSLLREPDRLWKAWFQPGSFIEYYPIDQTVQWYQWKLWGFKSAFGYHLTNLVLHLTSALLLWRLFSKLGLKLAWLGGLIFAIHPMMVETVATACELKNTLSLPPFLLAMGFYLDFENSRKPRDYCLALLLFLVAMLCKISMFFFPVVILLYAWWKRGRIAWSDVKASLPFFAISLVLGLIGIHALATYNDSIHYQSPGPIYLDGIFERIALAGLVLAFCFGSFFFPLHPMPIYPLWKLEPLAVWLFLPWVAIATVLFCCWKKRHGWGRNVFFGLAFFALGLAPFLGFSRITYMCLTWVTDHFVYIPIIGLIGLVVAGLDHLGHQLPRKFLPAGMALAMAALVLLGFRTHSYAKLFEDQEKLWSYGLKYNPNAWIAHYQLGQTFIQKKELGKAIEQFKESVRLNPDFYNAQLCLAVYLCDVGRISEGANAFAEAVRLNPNASIVHLNLAHALLQTGRISEAIDQFNVVLRLQPDSIDARYALSYALEKEGRIPEATAQIKTALDLHPRDPDLLARMIDLKDAQRQQAKPPAHAPVPSK